MAKRQIKPGTKPPKGDDSLIEAATRFGALAIEVQQAHILWQTKVNQLAGAREVLWAATRALLQDEQAATNPPRSRARRFFKGTLDSVIATVMADGRTRSTEDVMAAVQKAGYGSKAKPISLFSMVRAALGRMVRKKALKRLRPGQYVKT